MDRAMSGIVVVTEWFIVEVVVIHVFVSMPF